MIFFGIRAITLKTAALEQDKCPHCETQGSLTISIFQKYFHIFWIPAFPVGKVAYSECGHCKQVLEHYQMPPSITEPAVRIQASTKTPFYMFAFPMILSITIPTSQYFKYQHKQEVKEMAKSPRIGDILLVNEFPMGYFYLKVNRIRNDTTFFLQSKYEYYTERAAKRDESSIHDRGFFIREEEFGMSKEGIQKMVEQNSIYDLYRGK